MKSTWKRIDGPGGTSGTRHQLEIAPTMLRKLFGEPDESDGYKVSGEYAFMNEKGHIFTLYDWKATTLYSNDDGYSVDPGELWNSDDRFSFNVGSNHKGDFNEFVEWVRISGTLQLEEVMLRSDTDSI